MSTNGTASFNPLPELDRLSLSPSPDKKEKKSHKKPKKHSKKHGKREKTNGASAVLPPPLDPALIKAIAENDIMALKTSQKPWQQNEIDRYLQKAVLLKAKDPALFFIELGGQINTMLSQCDDTYFSYVKELIERLNAYRLAYESEIENIISKQPLCDSRLPQPDYVTTSTDVILWELLCRPKDAAFDKKLVGLTETLSPKALLTLLQKWYLKLPPGLQANAIRLFFVFSHKDRIHHDYQNLTCLEPKPSAHWNNIITLKQKAIHIRRALNALQLWLFHHSSIPTVSPFPESKENSAILLQYADRLADDLRAMSCLLHHRLDANDFMRSADERKVAGFTNSALYHNQHLFNRTMSYFVSQLLKDQITIKQRQDIFKILVLALENLLTKNPIDLNGAMVIISAINATPVSRLKEVLFDSLTTYTNKLEPFENILLGDQRVFSSHRDQLTQHADAIPYSGIYLTDYDRYKEIQDQSNKIFSIGKWLAMLYHHQDNIKQNPLTPTTQLRQLINQAETYDDMEETYFNLSYKIKPKSLTAPSPITPAFHNQCATGSSESASSVATTGSTSSMDHDVRASQDRKLKRRSSFNLALRQSLPGK